MDYQLYLLEVFLENITFSSFMEPVPLAKDISVSMDLGNKVSLLIQSEVQASSNVAKMGNTVALNSGKSSLFPSKPGDILDELKKGPLIMRVFTKGVQLGIVEIVWSPDFLKLVEAEPGKNQPVAIQETFHVKNVESDDILGELYCSIRLSSFGSCIQTNYQVLDGKTAGDDNKQYLIKNTRGNTTFRCQKYGASGENSDIFPIGPLFNPQAVSPRSSKTNKDFRLEQLSWTALFNSRLVPKLSCAPTEFKHVFSSNLLSDPTRASYATFDIVSIVERPSERKGFDLRIRHSSAGYVFEFDSPDDENSSESEEELTIENINKNLCKSKNCPAAHKFKEFGIGPLAIGKGLGSIYRGATLPVEYGLSHTYGTFDNYGPYGLFSRPKHPNQPFVPSQKDQDNETNAACFKERRRREENKERAEKVLCKCCQSQKPPLRLKGGGVSDYDDVKSPFHECKEIMDQMDEVLAQYKRALGPCGKTTCPFAPNIIKETCRRTCNHPMDFKISQEYLAEEVGDSEVKVPIPKEYLKLRPACGSKKCAYLKHRIGLTDEDADYELQFLPSASSGKCGHPKCPFPIEPDLPPIHWDCPDPLPTGLCKNPKCPFLPQDLKSLYLMTANNDNECGNSRCPYAIPPPCTAPLCPFNIQKECPYERTESCANPNCPFAPPKNDCEVTEEEEMCSNPNCPYANEDDEDTDELCQNPKCPSKVCSNPDCPFAAPAEKPDVCDNPTCPYAPLPVCQSKLPPCYVPQNQCGDPNCPFESPPPSACPMANPCMQQLLQYLVMCNSPTCPDGYNTQELDLCLGGPTCPFYKPPPTQEARPAQEMEYICKPDPCFYRDDDECDTSRRKSNQSATAIGDSGSSTKRVSGQSGGSRKASQQSSGCRRASQPQGGGDNDGGSDGSSARPLTRGLFRSKEYDLSPLPADSVGMTQYQSDTRISIDTTPCKKHTCKFLSDGKGELECEDCPCALASQSETGPCKSKNGPCKKDKKTKSSPELRTKGRKRGRYVYSMGEHYPGVKVGHKDCCMPGFMVPSNQGWLWNIHTPVMGLKPRRGWRPGAVGRTIAARIEKHRKDQGIAVQHLPEFRRKFKGKRGTYGDSGTSINVQPKPTLHIKKKDGCYWITMNPLKDPYSLVENENPYMECTPMQFKIVKNKDNSPIRIKDQNGEYKTCYCGENGEEILEEDTSSSESELDIEFTPPAGLIHPERFKRKKNVVHCDTQYDSKDVQIEKKMEKDKKGKKGKKGKGDKKSKKGKGKKKK